jgi:P-type Cu2+ transporter
LRITASGSVEMCHNRLGSWIPPGGIEAYVQRGVIWMSDLMTQTHSSHDEMAHDSLGHGGHGAMSMDAMVADMRRRFIVAAALSIPILLWSPIGRDVLEFDIAAPFGLRDDVWALLLSLPVVLWASWIFFDGAFRALRAHTLDMMVLVAVAIGAGWGY